MRPKDKDRLNEIFEKAKDLDIIKALGKMASFHDYSRRNRFLIYIQCPWFSTVAGFRTWKKYERHVKKGEKAISILAPRTYKTKEIRKIIEPGTVEEVEKEVDVSHQYFKYVPVFDISQTEGKEFPDLPGQVEQTNNFKVDDFTRTVQAIGKYYPVDYESLPYGTGGYTTGRRIVLNSRNNVQAQFTTLFHELGHILLKHFENKFKKSMAEEEIEAELFSAYWMIQAGYEYKHEINIGSWMKEGIDPLNVISAIDRIIGDAKDILKDDPGEVAEWQRSEGPTPIYPAVIV